MSARGLAPRATPPERSIASTLSEGVCLGLLVIVPLFFNLSTEQVFEEPKALVVRAAAGLLLALAVVGARPSTALYRHRVVATMLFALAVFAVAGVTSPVPHAAWMGAYFRRYGVATAAALAVTFIALATAAQSRLSRHRIAGTLVLGSVCPCVYALAQAAGFDPITWTGTVPGRAGSTAGNPLLFAGYLAVVIPFTAFECLRRRRSAARGSWWLAAALIVQVAALAMTASRGPAIAVFVGVGAGFAVLLEVSSRRIGWTLGVCAIVLGAIISVNTGWANRLLESGSGRVRVLIWQSMSRAMQESPTQRWIIGYGPEAVRLLAPKYYDPQIGRIENTDAMPDRSHNELLDTFVTSGICGVAAVITFYMAVLLCAARIDDPAVRAALVAATVSHFVEIQLGIATVMSRLAFIAVAALVVGESMPSDSVAVDARAAANRSRAPRPRPVREWVAAAAALAVAGFAAIPIAIRPMAADRYSGAALERERHQDWAAAADAYRAAAMLQPAEAHYLTGLGRAVLEEARDATGNRQQGLFEEAHRALTAARVLEPRDPYALRNLASVARRQAGATSDASVRETLLRDADSHYRAATELAPALPGLWVEWANVAAERNDAAAAVQHLDRAQQLGDTRSDGWILRGAIEARARHLDAALDAYDQAIRVDPSSTAALRGRAVVLVALRRSTEASAAVNELLAIAPRDEVGVRLRAALEQSN